MNRDHQLSPLRRSAALLLAHAVSNLFPGVIFVFGGERDAGFFYEFIFAQPLMETALSLIEVEMKKIAKEAVEIRSPSMMRENARDYFDHLHQPVLAEDAANSELNILPLGQIGSSASILEHPLVSNTQDLKSIKLTGIESFEEDGQVFSRITGLVSTDPQSLKSLYKAYEKWQKSTHETLGLELNLFSLTDEGAFWHPKGEVLKHELLRIWRKENERLQCQPISTPVSFDPLFTQHLKYFEMMHDSNPLLPIRFSEVRQMESEDDQEGLYYSSSYTSDVVTSLCKKEEVLQEIISSLQFIEQTVRIFDFRVHRHLIVAGSEKLLLEALDACGVSYSADKASDSKALPMIEWCFEDGLGRIWPGPTIALKRLSQGRFVIGRSLFSSLDRFIALLIERFEGELPFWLAPEQIRVLSVGLGSLDYAESVVKECRSMGYRVGWESRDEKLGVKIHAAEKERVPCVIIIGDKERSQKSVSVRMKHQQIRTMRLEDVSDLLQEVYKRSKGDH